MLVSTSVPVPREHQESWNGSVPDWPQNRRRESHSRISHPHPTLWCHSLCKAPPGEDDSCGLRVSLPGWSPPAECWWASLPHDEWHEGSKSCLLAEAKTERKHQRKDDKIASRPDSTRQTQPLPPRHSLGGACDLWLLTPLLASSLEPKSCAGLLQRRAVLRSCRNHRCKAIFILNS